MKESWCLLSYKRRYCDECPVGTVCALLAMAYEEAVMNNDYKSQALIEEEVEKWQTELSRSL
jgi:hypothetical protein